jgi:hypothetical protein
LRGGNGDSGGEPTADHADRVQEGELVGIRIGSESGFMKETADSEVGHHEPIELLAHQIRGLAAQDDPGAAQMGFQFVERGLKLPLLERLKGHFC